MNTQRAPSVQLAPSGHSRLQAGEVMHSDPVSQFIAALFLPEQCVELRLIRPEHLGEQVQQHWVQAAKIDAMVEMLEQCNQAGFGIYFGACPRRAGRAPGVTKDSCTEATPCGGCNECALPGRALVADFDDGQQLQVIHQRVEDSCLPQPSIVVETSEKHWQLWWLLESAPPDATTWAGIVRAVAAKVGSDPKACDQAHVFRLPGFANTKYETGFTCRIVECETAAVFDLQEFPPPIPVGAASTKTLLKSQIERAIAEAVLLNPTPMADRLKRCLAYIAKCPRAVVQQHGHNAFHRIARECARFGLDEPSGMEALEWFSANRSDPPWSPKEMRHKFASAYSRSLPEGEFGSRLIADQEDANDELFLSPAAPLETATRFINQFCRTPDGSRTLAHYADSFLKWDGRCYGAVESGQLRKRIYEWTAKAKYLKPKGRGGELQIVDFHPTKAKVDNILDALKASAHVDADPAPPRWLRGSGIQPDIRDLIACANGILNIKTRELIPSTPDFFNLNCICEFNEAAPQPKHWLAFLRELWGDDELSINAIGEWFGYLVSGDSGLQKMMMMLGPPRSGRGTIARVIAGVLGGHNVASPTLSGLAGMFGLQGLVGKSAAIISDARLSGRTDQAIVVERLLSISGEDGQDIHRKHLPTLRLPKLPTRIMILTNEIPRLGDSSGALASRFIVLKLTRSWLGREDPGLTARLLDEQAGILSWALDHLDNLRERGSFVTPGSATSSAQMLADLASPVQAFINDRCEVRPGERVPCKELYDAWRSWCQEQGRDHPGSAATFGRELAAAAATVERKQSGATWYYHGIRLVTDPSDRGNLQPDNQQQPDFSIARVKSDKENKNNNIERNTENQLYPVAPVVAPDSAAHVGVSNGVAVGEPPRLPTTLADAERITREAGLPY